MPVNAGLATLSDHMFTWSIILYSLALVAYCGEYAFGRRGKVLIAYGLPRELLERHYRTCTVQARIDAPLARPWDTDLPVYVCRGPFGTMAEVWPDVRLFGHKPPASRGPS